jgi:chromosome segregation ATPase
MDSKVLQETIASLRREIEQKMAENAQLQQNLSINSSVLSQKEAELQEIRIKYDECIKTIDNLQEAAKLASALHKMEQLVERDDLTKQLASKSAEVEKLRLKLRESKKSKDRQAVRGDFNALQRSLAEFAQLQQLVADSESVVKNQAEEIAQLKEQLEDMRVGARLNNALLKMNRFVCTTYPFLRLTNAQNTSTYINYAS